MNALAIALVERGLRAKNRVLGVGYHPDPHRYFGPGGVDEAEAACLRAGADLPAFVRPPDSIPRPADTVREERVTRWGTLVRFRFGSALPSGRAVNDLVHLRLYVPRDTPPGTPLVLFHHPIYQRSWPVWEWFLADLRCRMPVAMLAAPHHFDRVSPGEYAGQGTVNANPWRLYEAFRQWSWDQQVATDLLRADGHPPAAVVGFSLGAFQSLLLASAGNLDLPIVALAPNNRYAFGLQHGALGASILASMRAVGIDLPRLDRMVEGIQLERWVSVLRGRPVLVVNGSWDPVDPEPSGSRLVEALRPTRVVTLPAGHGSLVLFRRRISREIATFLTELGILAWGRARRGWQVL